MGTGGRVGIREEEGGSGEEEGRRGREIQGKIHKGNRRKVRGRDGGWRGMGGGGGIFG